ncbi:MAG: HAD-IB family phosphatase [Microthrixaceae bacterium]|nr:HAD-IB family phosphatase [Microthrixaceae bacterium]
MIVDGLAGTRIFVTGATGFVGTALVERLLRCVPDVQLTLLIRDGRRTTAQRRLEREVLRNDCFDRLRGELGADGFAEVAARVRAVSGDVGSDGLGLDDDGRAALSEVDVVIHSAATVAFDSPLDRAVEINLMGPVRIAETLNDLGITPHLVAVSTCYVAGNRRGAAPEEPVTANPFFADLDWRAEVDAARRTRADVDAESRTPERLDEFRARARSELGPAGGPLIAERTESLRKDWVHDRMVTFGRSRATSVGWPDAYAFTKALGEVALTRTLDRVRSEGGPDIGCTIVRPSIIESALAEPRPGWIRGFRMAEPIILSYARGLLREFPGVPEGVIDVIPVDLVVAAIIAAAAEGTAAAEGAAAADSPGIVQVATGDANPLRYQQLVDRVRDWFTERPLYDRNGQPIVVPDWTFPGRGRVEGQLRRATSVLERAERVVAALPLRGTAAQWGAGIEEKREQARRALSYVELYGAYTECEAVYGVQRLAELDSRLSAEDHEMFTLDPRVIDWDRYITEVHLPSVVAHGRARSSPSKRSATARTDRLRAQVLAPERQMAVFDLENTIIASNVVATYSWLATRRLGTADRVRFIGRTLLEAPALLAQDRKDRSDFLRAFYRRYEGAPVEELRQDAVEHFSDLLLTRSFPDAVRRVRRHRELGHTTVLITGALDIAIEPLTPLFDHVVCARLGTRVESTRSGPTEVLTGHLEEVPPTAEARARIIVDLCSELDLDPRQAVAYADSSSDLPMLEAVGFPVAVNPEPRLASIARKRGWLVEDFGSDFGHKVLPMGPAWRERRTGRRLA